MSYKIEFDNEMNVYDEYQVPENVKRFAEESSIYTVIDGDLYLKPDESGQYDHQLINEIYQLVLKLKNDGKVPIIKTTRKSHIYPADIIYYKFQRYVENGAQHYMVLASDPMDTNDGVNNKLVIYTLRMDGTNFVKITKEIAATSYNANLSGEIFFNKNSLILGSSTNGSTKKFRITVDDTGALTATQVV